MGFGEPICVVLVLFDPIEEFEQSGLLCAARALVFDHLQRQRGAVARANMTARAVARRALDHIMKITYFCRFFLALRLPTYQAQVSFVLGLGQQVGPYRTVWALHGAFPALDALFLCPYRGRLCQVALFAAVRRVWQVVKA